MSAAWITAALQQVMLFWLTVRWAKQYWPMPSILVVTKVEHEVVTRLPAALDDQINRIIGRAKHVGPGIMLSTSGTFNCDGIAIHFTMHCDTDQVPIGAEVENRR